MCMAHISRNFDLTALFASTVICTCTQLPKHHTGAYRGGLFRAVDFSEKAQAVHLFTFPWVIFWYTESLQSILLVCGAWSEFTLCSAAQRGGRWQCGLQNPAVTCCSQGNHLAVSCKKLTCMRDREAESSLLISSSIFKPISSVAFYSSDRPPGWSFLDRTCLRLLKFVFPPLHNVLFPKLFASAKKTYRSERLYM